MLTARKATKIGSYKNKANFCSLYPGEEKTPVDLIYA
jgi:hypothetical protein